MEIRAIHAAELEAAGFRVLSVDEAFTTRGSTRKALIVAER